MTKDKDEIYTALELLCVFFWFLLDGFWLLEWPATAYGFSALSLVCAAAMFFYIKHEAPIVLIVCADTSWLLCNILWAIGDLSHIKPAIISAKVLFGVGFLFAMAACYATESRKRLSTLILSRLRIMKFFKRTP